MPYVLSPYLAQGQVISYSEGFWSIQPAPKNNQNLNPLEKLNTTASHPKPSTLNPQPYTLHPAPYTLHPKPYTLHPAPYTPHPSPYTLHPTPYALHPTPIRTVDEASIVAVSHHTLRLFSGVGFMASNFCFSAWGLGLIVWSLGFEFLRSQCRV